MLVVFCVVALVVVGTSIWAAADAAQVRDRIDASIACDHPAAVFAGCLLFWIVGFPVYLAHRSKTLDLDSRMRAGWRPGGNDERARRIAAREAEGRAG